MKDIPNKTATECCESINPKPFNILDQLEDHRSSLIRQLTQLEKKIAYVKRNPSVQGWFELDKELWT